MYKLLCFAVILGCALARPNFKSKFPKMPYPDGRIVGGQDASIEDNPWQVSLQDDYGHFCGGSVVGKKQEAVVTAAHCGEYADIATLKVISGVDKLNATDSEITSVKEIVINENYGGASLDYDVCILKLVSAISNAVSKPVSLSEADQIPEAGTVLRTSGWGTTEEGGFELPNQLQSVEVPLVSYEDCKAAYGDDVTNGMVCAGYTEGGKDACQGDSGGPLVIASNNVLVGIVSWGYGCAEAGYPGVYASVPAFSTWIQSKIE